jgi:hypothetical protein
MCPNLATTPPDRRQADLPTTSPKDFAMRHCLAIRRATGTRPGRLRRTVGTFGALASLSVTVLGLSSAPALAEVCPNAALRAENNSTRLPDCRAYEMVTPLYKEGFGAHGIGGAAGFTDDGLVSFESTGNFAGNSQGTAINPYHATRSPAGWETRALAPPDLKLIYRTQGGGTAAVSPDLRESVWVMSRGDVPGERLGFWLQGSDGEFTRIGDAEDPGNSRYVAGATPDLSHILFNHGPQDRDLNEYIGTGNGELARPVGVDNTGAAPSESCFDSISPDGRVIVFALGCGNGLSPVWARIGGSVSVALSGSQCTRTSGDPGGACNAPAAASFAGAAADDSRVFFTTTQQLLNGDTDQTNDLYECDIPPETPAPVGAVNPCSSLSEVSGNAPGAGVENVVNVSEDGSRVYFVATGVLAGNLGTNYATAVAGDHNLYVREKDAAHPAGQTTFVAKLESASIEHPQSRPDGRYLVFGTTSRLLPSDTDEASDVYRYDADTGVLLRLSTDTNGGGGSEPGASVNLRSANPFSGPSHPAMTDDGGAVVFETPEALSSADTDGVTDVYEWHDGQVSLISDGGGEAMGISGSGRDIFFLTTQPLTAGDSGTEVDIYDARVEGGFPVPISAPCSQEACHGAPPLQPQPAGTSATAAVSGPGSPLTAETPPANQPKPRTQSAVQKLAKALRACHAKHNRQKRRACEKRARNTYRRAK